MVQDGEIVKKNIISSGTASEIAIANFLAEIIEGKCGFYYCDEKFSFVHSEVEKAILNIMVYPSDYLKRNTDSLKLAAENNLFLSSPYLDNLYTLLELKI